MTKIQLSAKLEMIYKRILYKGGKSKVLIVNNKTLTEWLGFSIQTCRSYLKKLESAGVLKVRYERGRGRIIEFTDKSLSKKVFVRNDRNDVKKLEIRAGVSTFNDQICLEDYFKEVEDYPGIDFEAAKNRMIKYYGKLPYKGYRTRDFWKLKVDNWMGKEKKKVNIKDLLYGRS